MDLKTAYKHTKAKVRIKLHPAHANILIEITKLAFENKQCYVKDVEGTMKQYLKKVQKLEANTSVQVKDIIWVGLQAESCLQPPVDAYSLFRQHLNWISVAINDPGKYERTIMDHEAKQKNKPQGLEAFIGGEDKK